MADKMRCPKCGSERLSLGETHEEHGSTDFGVIRIDEYGALIAPTEFIFEAGDSIRLWIDCGVCGHAWRPRRQSVSSSRPANA